jgi:uncharacterized protein YuzE
MNVTYDKAVDAVYIESTTTPKEDGLNCDPKRIEIINSYLTIRQALKAILLQNNSAISESSFKEDAKVSLDWL